MKFERLKIFLFIAAILIIRCSSRTLEKRGVINIRVLDDDESNEVEEESNDDDDEDDVSENEENEYDNSEDSNEEDEESNESRMKNLKIYQNGRLNPSEYEDFYDVELPEEMTNSEFSDEGGTGILDEAKRWKSYDGKVIIPYIIDGSSYSYYQKQNIMNAMKEIQSKTCVKFTPRDGENNYITFKSHPQKGCSSMVGMQGGQQFINLNKDGSCANKKGIIMHEILHALGFHHMHTHSARDRYIKFIEKNIKNFLTNRNYFLNDAARVSSFNTKYDFYSIMHYPPFNPIGKRMIKPHKKYMYYDDFMGQRKALSDGDVDRVNKMYECLNIGERNNFGIRGIQMDGWKPLSQIFSQNFQNHDRNDDDSDTDENEDGQLESEDDESEENDESE